MTQDAGYALVDAGGGRRLERFGARLVDRPAPGAVGEPGDAGAWAHADLRFDRVRGWEGRSLEPWTIEAGGLTLELRPTEAGQVGLFPEHAAMWPWLVAQGSAREAAEPPEVLHLFASTGATTLALARAGARVAHVDAARPAVAWARRNAELSGLTDRPVRWLVDDAAGFTEREIRRERTYAGLVLDPPAYGHGAGRPWRLEDDLPRLLHSGARLLGAGGFVLLTTHTVGWDAGRLAGELAAIARDARVEAGALDLVAESGVTLTLGAFARVIIDR